MASKDVKLKTLDGGSYLYPETKAGFILDDTTETKIGQEHIVNKIESIKDGSTALTITDKEVTLPEFDIVKADTAEEGYAATYRLMKKVNGGTATQVGASINIIKDFLIKSVTLETCSEDDKPVEGYKKGDKYIDFVINVKDEKSGTETDSHIYLLVKELVDAYTAGNGLTLSADNKFSVNITANKGLGFDSSSAEGTKTLEVLIDTDKAIAFDSDGKLGVQTDSTTVGYNATSKALEVVDSGITTVKLADEAVTSAKLADEAVNTTTKFTTGAVFTGATTSANGSIGIVPACPAKESLDEADKFLCNDSSWKIVGNITYEEITE